MATAFTNQATLSFNGSTIQSNVAVGLIEEALIVSKEAVSSEYASNDTVTYIVSIVNNGDTPAQSLTVTDNLGAYAFGAGTLQPLTYKSESLQYYQNGVLQPDPTATITDGLVISGINVPANGNALLVYSASVNEYAPLSEGSTVTNTVTVTGANVYSAEDEAVISAVNEAQLSLIKSVTPVPVAENGELSYTFQLQNTGNTAVTVEDNAAISDTFDPILTDINVSLNGEPLTTAEYTYDENTGVFSTIQGIITVPAATFTQDAATGEWTVTPGSTSLRISGSIGSISDITEKI